MQALETALRYLVVVTGSGSVSRQIQSNWQVTTGKLILFLKEMSYFELNGLMLIES